jgi:S1-C subfamily serine protease
MLPYDRMGVPVGLRAILPGSRMTPSQGSDAKPAQKPLAALAVKVQIAVASALVLAIGAWIAPRIPATPLSVPEERPAPLLEQQVQLQEAARPFRGVQDVATRVRDYNVAIPSTEPRAVATENDFSETIDRPQAAGFGVFVSERYVLTHALALDGRTSAQVFRPDGSTVEGQVVAYEPSSGLVLLQPEGSGSPSVVIARESPEPGTLAVAVGRWEGRDVAVPLFITHVEDGQYRVAAANGSVLPGMPVYNVDGELLAVAGGDDGEGAFAVPDAADRLIARASAGERLTSLGIAFQELTGSLTRAFGDTGVLISDVVPGGPADIAGIQPGDVLLAIGEVAVDSSGTATRVLGSATVNIATTLRVLRTRRVRTLEVTPASAYEVAALARAREGPSGPEARALFPGALLDRASIPGSAGVISVNGRTVTSRAQAQRELRRSRQPAVLSLVHGNRRFFAVVERAP